VRSEKALSAFAFVTRSKRGFWRDGFGHLDRLLTASCQWTHAWRISRSPGEAAVPILDALLAATALVHDLTVISRDEEGFRNTGVRVINPFSKAKLAGN
jgi:hypothetical protein